jgi:hypothetical protein
MDISNPIPSIQNAKHSEELYFSYHALARMVQRKISVAQIEQALDCSEVEIVQVYPQNGQHSSEYLILGIDGGKRCLHILVACPINEVITTYEPQAPKWVNPRQRGNL